MEQDTKKLRVGLGSWYFDVPAEADKQGLSTWVTEQAFDFENGCEALDTVNYLNSKGLKITLSKPALVGRSKWYFWYPAFSRLANGDIIMKIFNTQDEIVMNPTGLISWSGNNGLSWSEPAEVRQDYNTDGFNLPDGDFIMFPFFLRNLPDGAVGGKYNIFPYGKREIKHMDEYVKITGLPNFNRKAILSDKKPSYDIVDREFSGYTMVGMVEKLKDGGYISTVVFGAEPELGKCSLYAIESDDGINWKHRSTIADGSCELPGDEGPNEAAMCRLNDGRLMCVFRMSQKPTGEHYGQTWSSDEGKTWIKPVEMFNAFSVYPRLTVMKNGMVLLTGGRPGTFLWVNADGTGESWRQIDMVAHHNICHPEEPINYGGASLLNKNITSGYADTVVLDDTHVLYVYDRMPYGWAPIPEDSSETNSIWMVQAVIEKG